MPSMPIPPAFGVCESVPMIKPPGLPDVSGYGQRQFGSEGLQLTKRSSPG
jgi:hypothetical protein